MWRRGTGGAANRAVLPLGPEVSHRSELVRQQTEHPHPALSTGLHAGSPELRGDKALGQRVV